jgi:hypothetical protein
MDTLTLFGVFSVILMVAFYALEKRSNVYILGFSIACILAAVYGFLAGAWPFSIAEVIWSGVAFRRWHVARKFNIAVMSQSEYKAT